ncbi:GDSL-type esterase/lipase family protein [Lentzea sp. NPDC051208]|uniref:GDSL-type esterase/lipase family protein n=1 Tax=Lentzea sp. NPDC051208 TaxID=3154642 RepID=UPI00343A92DC
MISLVGAAAVLYFMGRDHPKQWESRVDAIRQRFAAGYPQGEVLLTGSSYMEYWRTSAEDLTPLATTNIGIGGTKAGDHIAYFDRMIVPFAPAALVVYIGSNDISGLPFFSKSADETVSLVEHYLDLARTRLPKTRIYYIAITEAPSRERVRPEIQKANRALADLARSRGDFTFIDTAPALLRTDGSIDHALFADDRLHLNAEGYRRFATAVKAGLCGERAE